MTAKKVAAVVPMTDELIAQAREAQALLPQEPPPDWESPAWQRGAQRAREALAQGEVDLAGRTTITLTLDGGPGAKYQRQSFKLCLVCGWGTDTPQHRAHSQ